MEGMEHTYLNILIDTMRKKNALLRKLENDTMAQEVLLSAGDFDLDAFNKLIDSKSGLLQQLEQLDGGFEEVYRHVSSELQEHRELYRKDILVIQELIREATELNVKLRTQEERNRNRLSIYLSENRQKIKDFKVGSKTATAYYKNMSNQHVDGQSYFLDKKK